MSYIEENLNRDEEIVMKASFDKLSLRVWWIIVGIFFLISLIVSFIKFNNEAADMCMMIIKIYFWFIAIIMLIAVVIRMVRFNSQELLFTDNRILGKVGVVNIKTMDAPLDKVQTVTTAKGMLGLIFNYGSIVISTAAEKYSYSAVKNPELFKKALMEAIAKAEKEQLRKQAEQLAAAVQAK